LLCKRRVSLARLRDLLDIQGEILEVRQSMEDRIARRFEIVIEGPEGLPVFEGEAIPFVEPR